MKKRFCVWLLVAGVLVCLAGCQSAAAGGAVSCGTENSTVKETVDAPTQPLSLRDQLLEEIDGAYAAEAELPENCTTVGMCQLAAQYTEKWAQVADEYYGKIMAYDGREPLSEAYYTAEELHTFVANLKTGWEQYYAVQKENYVKVLQAVYAGGTIVGPMTADHLYQLQRTWALQLVDIYQLLY